MKPHPRIRKTVKWGGAVVSVLLLVVWMGSAWWYYHRTRGNYWMSVVAGRFVLQRSSRLEELPDDSAGVLGRFGDGTIMWWYEYHRRGADWNVWVPLWLPVGISLVVTATAWRLDTLARRRARIGLCPKCGYNRTGLAPQAVCPECGTPAIVPPPAAS